MSEPKIRNPDYVARVGKSLASQAFMHQVLRATVGRVAPGEVEIIAEARAELLQPGGQVHGSVLAALADSAAGYAAQTLVGPELDIVTAEFKLNFMAPGFGERWVARGRVLRSGRTLSVCSADVFGVQGGQEKLVAHMLTTMMAVPTHD
jgi:uncharacterized protein (TIGR00369 family)